MARETETLRKQKPKKTINQTTQNPTFSFLSNLSSNLSFFSLFLFSFYLFFSSSSLCCGGCEKRKQWRICVFHGQR